MKAFNLTIDDYTSPILQTAKPTDGLNYILHKMEGESYRHIPVLEGDYPIGILSDRDLKIFKSLPVSNDVQVKDVMINNVITFPVGASMEEVAFKMSESKIGSVIVVNEDGTAEGIFTLTDALNALVEILRGEINS